MIQLLRRQFGICALILMGTLVMAAASARADITISDPANGAVVRGEITVHFTGIPDGGYAIIKIDGNFVQATSLPTFTLNTFDAQSFGGSANTSTDGQHQISITGVDASGKPSSTASLSITVANSQVDVTAPTVKLTHWVPQDRLDQDAQRYRIFAESDAIISGQTTGGGGSTAPATGVPGGNPTDNTGAAASGGSFIPAPLDWQYSALMRRVVRDVGLYDGAANVKTVIQEAFQRQREGEGGGNASSDATPGGAPGIVTTAANSTDANTSGAPAKAPWAKMWVPAPELGTYFVKTIKPDGEEINATRKKRSIAITDLLPTFPTEAVQPGSRWETLMTFLSDLSSRQPFNVKAPITFTGFEDIKLPSGTVRHAAKLECRFTINQDTNGDVATKMAADLAVRGGIGGGGTQSASPTGDAGIGATPGATTGASDTGNIDAQIEAMEQNIASVSIRVSRVIWFDVDMHRVLRSQDNIHTYFQMKQPPAAASTGQPNTPGVPGVLPGADAGGTPAAPAQPTTVDYTMNVTTWYDDSVPPPTDEFNGGAGTAHSKDNVQEQSIATLTGAH